MSGGVGAELVEVVDDKGEVIDIVPRSTVREKRLRHRCTYVAVVTSALELIVHQRADWKDVYPSYWDICFGGIAGVGERWEVSAGRELMEEAGISGVDLRDLGVVAYDAPDGRVFGRVYLAHHDGPITCPDGEVVQVDRIALIGSPRGSQVDRSAPTPSSWSGRSWPPNSGSRPISTEVVLNTQIPPYGGHLRGR